MPSLVACGAYLQGWVLNFIFDGGLFSASVRLGASNDVSFASIGRFDARI